MHCATTVIRTAKPSSSASVPRRVGTEAGATWARGSVLGGGINAPPGRDRGLRRSLVGPPAVHLPLGRRGRRPSRRRCAGGRRGRGGWGGGGGGRGPGGGAGGG